MCYLTHLWHMVSHVPKKICRVLPQDYDSQLPAPEGAGLSREIRDMSLDKIGD